MIVTIVVFIFILSVLVLIHELGHFIVARIIGVHVEEFGMGLPPRIWGKKIKDTVYSLNWLPIGGFVKLAGEDDDQPDEMHSKVSNSQKKFFWARSKKERSVILIAGVTMNFILAVAITAGLLLDGVKEPSGKVRVEAVTAGSPAASSGLQPGDIITQIIIGKEIIKVTVPNDLISTVKKHAGESVILDVNRDNQILPLNVTPRKTPPKGEGPLGVTITDLELRKYSISEAPFMALKINVERAYLMLSGIISTLWSLVTLKMGKVDVAGPIGIAQVTGEAVKFGFRAVLEFMSILSLNLAVLNILPIPALDGGRLLFVFLEKILGRRIKPAFEKQTHQIGMLILLILVLLVSLNDILRITRGG